MTGNRNNPALSTQQLTMSIALFLAVVAGALNVALMTFSPSDHQETGLDHTIGIVKGQSGDDSWGPMAFALEYFDEGGSKPLYTTLFFDGGIKFQYPPSALFSLEAMQWLAPEGVRIHDGMSFEHPPINDVAGWLSIALVAMAVAAILETALVKTHPNTNWRKGRSLRVLLCALATLTFYPIAKAFTLGQIQLWIDALVALAVLGWIRGRPLIFGVLVGIAALIKPHLGLLLIWAVFAGSWRAAAAGVAVSVAGLIASVAHYGFVNHTDYLRVLAFLSERGEAFYPNQSVNGLLNRILSLSSPGQFHNTGTIEAAFPPYSPLVRWGTAVSSATMILGGLAVARLSRDRDGSLGLMLCVVTIASPIAWEHHYGVMLPAFALMLPKLTADLVSLAGLAVSYMLIATYIDATRLLASSSYNFLQSYMLFGGLLLSFVAVRTAMGWNRALVDSHARGRA